MPDLLVKIYDLNLDEHRKEDFDAEVRIVRAMTPDKSKVLNFIRAEFTEDWADECERSFSNGTISCFIAVRDKEVIGFACYDATAKGFFGPTGVKTAERGNGIGTKLLFSCLKDMWDNEYGYAIIGWVKDDTVNFYQTTVSATIIPDSSPGIYKRLVNMS